MYLLVIFELYEVFIYLILIGNICFEIFRIGYIFGLLKYCIKILGLMVVDVIIICSFGCWGKYFFIILSKRFVYMFFLCVLLIII